MLDTLIALLAPQLRKLIYGACMTWIALIIEWATAHNIPITEAVIENWINILIALAVMAVVSVYTVLKNKLTGKVQVAVPTAAVPEVKAIVEAVK